MHRDRIIAALKIDQQRLGIVLHLGIVILKHLGVQHLGVALVAHIEGHELQALLYLHIDRVVRVVDGMVTDAEERVVVYRHQQGGKSADLDRAEDDGLCRVGGVDRKQRVGLLVGDHIGSFVDIAHCLDALAFGKSRHRADLIQRAVEHKEIVYIVAVLVG